MISILDGELILNDAMWCAHLGIDNSWSDIRIGFLYYHEDDGFTSINGVNRFYLGMSSSKESGMANGPILDAGNFLGFGYNDFAFSRTAGPPPYFTVGSYNLLKKEHGTFAASSSGGAGIISLSPSIRTAAIIRLVKGVPPAWNYEITCNIGVNGLVDVPISAVKAALETTGANVATTINTAIGGSGTRYSTGAGSTLTNDEATYGNLVSICAAWQMGYFKPHITNIFFKKAA